MDMLGIIFVDVPYHPIARKEEKLEANRRTIFI